MEGYMRKFRSWNYFASICLALVLIVGTLLTACSTSETSTSATTPPTSTTAPPTSTTAPPTSTTAAVPVSVLGCPQGPPTPGLVPQYGGTVKIIYNNNPTNLGEMWKINTAFDKSMNRFAIENLIGLDPLGKPIPQLASSWVSDEVNKTITFTLREGVKFHDGYDFNAATAKWCLEMYRDGAYKDLAAVTSIDAIDNNHLRLTLSSWDPLFIQQFSSTGAGKMVSPYSYQQLGDDFMLNPVGTGPFKFVSFQPNVSLKYARFDDYWQKGLPYLDAVEVDFVADSVVALTSFTKGEAHVLYDVDTHDAVSLKDKGNTIYTTTLTIMGITGDSKNPDSLSANINFRRAIAYAIDVKKDVDAIYGGMMASTTQLALPGMQAYNSSIQGYPYNPDKAKSLLEPLGITLANPLTIDFVYGTNPERNDLFTLVQGDLAKVGINIVLKPLDRTAQMKISTSGWTNQLMQTSFSYNGLEMQYSTSVQGNLSANKVSLVSMDTPAEFQTLFLKAKAETDMDKREAYYEQLNKMAIDDYCIEIPLFALQNLTADSPKVHDCGIFNKTSGEFLPERIWLSK